MTSAVIRVGYCLAIAGFAWSLAQAAPSYAGSGYLGLFAPSDDDAKKTTEQPAPALGYEGVIAAPPDPRKAPEEPLGYSGLVPGQVKTKDKPHPATDLAKPKSADDIKALAAASGAGKIEPPKPVAEASPSRSGKPQRRIDNMLPAEFAAKQSIDRMMPGIRDKKIGRDVRDARVKKTYDKLSTMASGLRRKNAVSDKTYKAMGVSDTFIHEEHEGNTAALARLDKALAELKKYQ